MENILIFISYSFKDSELVHKISNILKKSNISTWIAEDHLFPGESVENVYAILKDEIRKSDFFIPIITESSIRSDWVKIEMVHALSKQFSNEVIIPVFLGTKSSTLPFTASSKIEEEYPQNDFEIQYIAKRILTLVKSKSQEKKTNLETIIKPDELAKSILKDILPRLDKIEITLRIMSLSENPKDFEDFFEKLLKTEEMDLDKKIIYLTVISEILDDWKILQPTKWEKVKKIIYSVIKKVTTDKIAEYSMDSFKIIFDDLFKKVNDDSN